MATSGFARVALVISAMLLTSSGAQSQTVANWQGGSGDWTDDTKWDIGIVPNNAGGDTYQVVIDPAGEDPIITVNGNITISGLSNRNSVRVATGGTLTCSGNVMNEGSLTATGGVLRFNSSTITNNAQAIAADGGIVEIIGSTINGGSLRVSDEAGSQVRFSGDVTLNGVPWVDEGAGEFQVYNTSAQFMEDYAGGLPAGYTLAVWSHHSGAQTRLTLAGGSFVNDGLIELRHSGGNYQAHPSLHWLTSGSLEGTGEVWMNSPGGEHEIPWLSGAGGVELQIGPDQWVHGRGEIQVDVVNQGLLEADVSGRSLRLKASLLNKGIIGAANGGTLVIQGSTVNEGTIRTDALSGGELTFAENMTNTGTLDIAGVGVFELNGTIDMGLDMVSLTGQTLRISQATVANTGHEIAADGGIVEIIGSTINGGSLRVSGEAGSQVRFSGDVTLNGVPWVDEGAGEFQVYNTSAQFMGDYAGGLPAGYTLAVWSHHSGAQTRLTLAGGSFVNDGLIELRHSGGNYQAHPSLHWLTSGSLEGTGEVWMNSPGGEHEIPWLSGAEGVEVQIGPDQWVHGRGEIQVDVVNQGLLEADVSGQELRVTGSVQNPGVLRSQSNGKLIVSGSLGQTGIVEAFSGTVDVGGTLTVNDPGGLNGQPTGTILLRGHLLANTLNKDLFTASARLVFGPAALSDPPQFMEVMGRDLGPAAKGFESNFALGSVALTQESHVRLIDDADNAEGSDPETLYVSTLSVPDGATLDLNGLNLYTRAAQVDGVIQGGKIQVIPDSGPLLLANPTPGEIATSGEIDEWTFFARAGRGVAVVVNPGSGQPSPALSPYLNFAEVQLLDPLDTVLATVSTSASGVVTTIPGVQLSGAGTYRVRVRAAQGHETATGKYSITLWDSTATEIPLVFNDTLSGKITSPYAVDHWTFAAEAGQQIRLRHLSAADGNVVFDLTGPEGWTGFNELGGSSDLVSLPASGRYTLAGRAADGQDGGAYAFQLEETEQTDLELSVAYSGTVPGSGHARLFRINLDESSPLFVTLDDAGEGNRSQLSARRGSPPTPEDYDFRSIPAGSADQQLLIPMAAPGMWYVLLYTDYTPSPGAYTLLAKASAITLLAVTPEKHGNGAETVIALTGAGFEPPVLVDLVGQDDSIYEASETEVHSFVRLSATFEAGEVPAGIYSVRVTRADDRVAELLDAFEMVAGGEAELSTDVIVPAQVGYHQLATLYIEYANIGEVAMPAPLLSMTPTQNGRSAALLTLDASRVKQGFWTTAIPEGFGNSVQFLASGKRPGWLLPGESGRVPIYWAGWQQPWDFTYSTIQFNLAVVQANNSDTKEWSPLKEQLRPDWIGPDAWNIIYANLTSELGDTWGGYVRRLNQNAERLSKLGQHVTDIDSLWGFELQQAMGLNPLGQLASRSDITLPTPGLTLRFGRVYAQRIDCRFDLGPFGRGWFNMWSTFLQVQQDGAVEINGAGGSVRRFEPDRRTGGYFSPQGERSLLSQGTGTGFVLTEPEGIRLGFRADGNLAYLEDPNGNRITATYSANRLSALSHSAGPALAISYYDSGRIASITDSWERTIDYEYDTNDEHLIRVRNYQGLDTAYSYDTTYGTASEHALKSITYPDDTHRFFAYDNAGRLASLSRGSGAERITFAYDEIGGVTRTDLAGASNRYFYDAEGSLARFEQSSGRILNYTFDDFHRVSEVADESGRTIVIESTCCGVITSQTDALGNLEQFTFDGPPRRMQSSTSPRGNTTRYSFDSRGNLAAIIHPDQAKEQFSHDDQGKLLSVVNRRGQTTQYLRDDLGRVTREITPDGGFIDYSLDEKGNLLTITNARGITRFEYDSNERLTKITYPNERFLRYGYDTAGRRIQTTDHTGFTVNYTHDSAGRLSTLKDASENLIIAYQYDNRGLLVREDHGNGTYTTVDHDLAGRVTRVAHYAPDGEVNTHFDYAYDPLGRVATMSNQSGQWTYEHDATDQLIRAVFDSTDSTLTSQDLNYEYDAAGNRILTIENGITKDHQVNSLNQYTTFGTETYRYDLAGNLTSKTDGDRKYNFEYDYQDRLIRAVTPDGTWDYEYDALGNRCAVIHDGQGIEYLADPLARGVIVSEFSADGAVQAQNVYGLGLVSRVDNAGELYYNYDALGSTVGITDIFGTSVNRYSYLPFGGKLDEVVTRANPHQFGGRYGLAEDGTGLIRMGARFYDPGLGRFTSQDPIGLFGGDPNLYRYVGNDAVGAIDPFGLAKSGGPNFDWSFGPPGGDPDATGNTECNSADDCTIRFDITNPAWPCIVMHELIHWANRDDWLGGGQSHDRCMREEILASRVGEVCAKRMGYSEYEQYQGAKADGLEKGKSYENCDKKPGPRYTPPPPPGDPAGDGKPAAPADPNAKTGPGGTGAGAYVVPTQVMPYRIEFENDPTATAPAQFVVVTDQLDANFDWETFELTEIGFGDQLLIVPANRRQFATSIPMTYNDTEFVVQIRVGLDLGTGQITARFMSIDPKTDLPPDVLTGFLPPEDGTGRGQGHFGYVIQPEPGLSNGTEIRNVAVIEFDFGETIATNQVDPHDPEKGTDPALEALVTIDAGPPSSRVMQLPAQTEGNHVQVSWRGQDNGGSGVAGYDVHVSDNGGDWTLWRSNVADTSALFTGHLNHTYAFYSVARDWLGHEEAPPATADAITTMEAVVLPEILLQVQYTDGSVRISWPSGMEGYFLETADTLVRPIPWERVDATPEADGDHLTITIEAGDTTHFYRLVKP